MTATNMASKIAEHYDTKVDLGNADLNERITDGVIVHHHEGLVSEPELKLAQENKANQEWLEHFIYQKEMSLLKDVTMTANSELTAASSILDAGCGRGGAAIQLAQTYSASVTGISLSPKQVDFGVRSVKKLGLESRVNLVVGDMLSSGFKTASFDVVLALGSSEHISNLSDMATEFSRLTKEGATVIIYTWVVNYSHPKAAFFKKQVDDWYHTDIHSVQEYEDALRDHGWQIVTSEDFNQAGAQYWSVRGLLEHGSGSERFMTPGFNLGALGYQLLVARKVV